MLDMSISYNHMCYMSSGYKLNAHTRRLISYSTAPDRIPQFSKYLVQSFEIGAAMDGIAVVIRIPTGHIHRASQAAHGDGLRSHLSAKDLASVRMNSGFGHLICQVVRFARSIISGEVSSVQAFWRASKLSALYAS